jgi:hypothetical protein
LRLARIARPLRPVARLRMALTAPFAASLATARRVSTVSRAAAGFAMAMAESATSAASG